VAKESNTVRAKGCTGASKKQSPHRGLAPAAGGIGAGTVVVGGEARVDAVDGDPLRDERYQAKYHDYAGTKYESPVWPR
jgi:hypothetical protein